MTLRFRLIAALVVLVAVGLVLFGFTTYRLYAASQYDRLDDQLRASVSDVQREIFEAAGFGDGPGRPTRGGAATVPPGTYGELRQGDALLATVVFGGTSDSATPELADELVLDEPFTAGSADGASGRWRVLATEGFRDTTVVAAVPTAEVEEALRRLVLVEAAAGTGLLLLLGTGSWFVLRRGLRPLERMAATARTISAGDLSVRVTPDDGRTEVGQLGVALNGMLGDLETAFAEREENERRLRQFLADASHELRTPLTSIQGFAELFRLGSQRGGPDLDVIMRRIEQESQRMGGLVEDLLLLARLDETRPFEPAPVDLSVLAADACSDAVAADPLRRVILDAPSPVVIDGDVDHLRQAIANLVTNAVRHTPSGTPIEVSAHVEGAAAVVRVRDHGAGLDEEALARVFDRFWQADRARSGTGSGLGLAIVAGIAEEHGGRAHAENAPDGGAVFTLELPLAAAIGAKTQEARSTGSGSERIVDA